MNESIYYLSIQSTSLAHYMSKALILSSRFYKNRPTDIQDIESDYLILSKNKFLNNSNCSIELVLEKEEIDTLVEIENTNIFLYSKPIPISRIKQIYFIDEIQKLKTIDNINRGTAFIPTILSKVIAEENINVDIVIKDKFNYSDELESKIKTYNHVLGGLAFVKHTLDGEYTKNYFSILSHFNSSIGKKNRLAGYDGAFTHKGKVWDKLSPLIYENISEDDVERYAKEEDITIEKSNGVFKYENINNKSITYKLAILNTYGEDSSKRKKTNDLISDCKNGRIPNEKQEGIALIFGINNGYSSFRNSYDKKIVKFKMESLLDYYTIESVFQYVINDKKDNGKFEYIDSLFPNEELVLDISGKAFDLEEYLVNITKYFKENIFNMSLKELLDNLINKFKKKFNEEMNKKDSELKNIKFKIAELNQEVVTKENKLQKQQNIVNQLNEKNDFLNQKLEERDNNINELNKFIEDKDKSISSLKQEVKTKDNELKEQESIIEQLNKDKNILNQKLEEKEKNINTLKNDKKELNKCINEKNIELESLNQNMDNKVQQINNLNKSIENKDDKVTFDEEKERIIIEQTLESYIEYDRKKAPELKKIAKEKGIKYTNKSDTIKSILVHKDNRLL